MSNKKYFNFPICLLNGFMNNTEAVCNDIIWFVIYAYCQYYDTDEDTACRYFGLNADGAEIPNMYVSRFSKIPQNIPYCGIDKEIIFEYKDSYKSDYDKAVLLAYLAIKSILGEKPYYKPDQSSKAGIAAEAIPAPILVPTEPPANTRPS